VTRRVFRATELLLVTCLLGAPVVAQVVSPPVAVETVDYDAIYRIKDEGFQRSQPLVLLHFEPQGVVHPRAERRHLAAPGGGHRRRQEFGVDGGTQTAAPF